MATTLPKREFIASPAVRTKVPLLVGLMGASGSGKTYSALRLATGIQKVSGGDIYFIDTESRRGLHYADKFKFKHVPFVAPFGSLDYLAALQFCVNHGAGVVVVDSMSHEHEGPGGMIDLQDQIVDRMAGQDYAKRERVKMLAWAEPKAKRRALINGILQLNSNFVFCFRAKNTSKPVKRDGKNVVEPQGFMPIAGDEFVYEQTLNALLMPGSGGVPTWQSDMPGEHTMIKLPEQFLGLASRRVPLDEKVGERLAAWASGGEASLIKDDRREFVANDTSATDADATEGPSDTERGEANSAALTIDQAKHAIDAAELIPDVNSRTLALAEELANAGDHDAATEARAYGAARAETMRGTTNA